MGPKEGPSKRAIRDKKTALLEDATFGLKNKNKSKKVQQFISRVEKTVKHSHGGADAEKAKELKKEAKLAKQLQEMELNILFNEGISNQFGKKKSTAQSKASALGLTESNSKLEEFLEAISSESENDSDDDNYPRRNKSDGPVFIEADESVATEVFREKTIEDIIEEQRAKLAAEGKKGTPVTAESFAVWRAAKLLQKQEEAEARLKAEQAKKKGGKGLSVLSGKELFSYNAALFVDDDGAIDASEESAMSIETKLRQEKEEQRQREEEERIQAEQARLAELQLLELQVRRRREEDRRVMACQPGRTTFILAGVVVNQVVFEEDEEEDLAPFAEEKLVEVEEREAVMIGGRGGEEGDGEHDAEGGGDVDNNSYDDQEDDDDDEDEDAEGGDMEGDDDGDESDGEEEENDAQR